MHRTMVMCFRGISACALMVVVMIVLHQPLVARDRPGTPNVVTADRCDFDPFDYLPRLCGSFDVTATEENRTEVEVTRNGAPVALNANQVFCPNERAACWSFQAIFKNTTRDLPVIGPKSQGGATVITYGWKDLDFGTQYCFHFRARRTSDQVVSELWSAWACAKTPDKPPVPVLPEFAVSFSGSQMLNKPAVATPGGMAQVIPEKMQIKFSGTTTAAYLYAFVYPTGAAIPPLNPRNGKPRTALFFSEHLAGTFTDELKIPEGLTTATVQVCGANISGKVCNTKTVSIVNSNEVQFPRTSAPVVRPPGAPQPAPAPVVRAPGPPGNPPAAAPTQKPIHVTGAPKDESFMAGTDLPGSDYRNAALNDNNATTCKTMCATDAKCLAWTWVKPGVQNAKAMCWLKNAVPPSHPNPNVTSGIKVTNEVIH